MLPASLSEEDVFQVARHIDSTEALRTYLDQACGDDAALRQQVDSLLAAHETSESFLESPPSEIASELPTRYPIFTERPGTIIGQYKLLQQIGEGGMGVVFMAEQTEPLQRTVALKIMKPGMDTRQVIARFEAERQAVAMMDHPNIAKVLDAGTTDSGRPYFVMELVKGIAITKYCDEKHLPIAARLKLFVQVCQAVQHAHQKGIIHRDIKPNNVLVAEYDNHAIPKVIDFGVAKATAHRLTERTMFTEFGQIIGTVEYMSPEQAKLNQLDIDTRTDLYSLGVLLYELLTGSTPFEQKRLREAAFDEVLRIIREEEPPKPSTRLSSSDTLPSVAANRHTEPSRLSKDVRGELDWIVMKCLEKDRDRRYGTANGLAGDIDRFLQDEPVQACPPSAGYRFGKFARRNKVALWVALASFAGLLVLVVVLGVSNLLIANERNQKAAALVAAESQRKRAEENFMRARVAVTSILGQAAMGVDQWSQLTPSLREKFAQEAVSFYEKFLQDESTDPSLQFETAVAYRALADLYRHNGEVHEAEKFTRQSIAILDKLATQHASHVQYRQQLAYSHYILARTLIQTKQLTEAESALRRSAELYEALFAERPDSPDFFTEQVVVYVLLVKSLKDRGALQEAERSATRLLELPSKVKPSPPVDQVQQANFRIGKALLVTGLWDEAINAFRNAIQLDPKNSAWSHTHLGNAMLSKGQVNEGIVALEEALRINPEIALAQFLLGEAYKSNHQWKTALAAYESASRLKPNFHEAHDRHAWLLVTCPEEELRDPFRAFEVAQRAIDASPNYTCAWHTLAVAYAGLSETEKAQVNIDAYIDKFSKAVDESPKDVGLVTGRARVYCELQRWNDATRDFDQAVDLDSSDPVHHYWRALTQLGMGHAEGYRSSCATMLKQFVNSTSAEEAYWIAWTCALSPNELKDLSPAVKLAENAVAFQPTNVHYLSALGSILYRTGRYEEAVERLGDADRRNSDPSRCDVSLRTYGWYFLAMAQHKLGNQDEAAKWFNKAIQWTEQEHPVGSPPMQWNRRLTLKLLRAETDALISGSGKELGPQQEPESPATETQTPKTKASIQTDS